MDKKILEYSDILLKEIDDAKTLEELGISTLKYLMVIRGIQIRYFSTLALRVSWVNGKPKTLDEAAEILEISRERVRQVEHKLKPFQVDLIVAPKLIYSIIGILGRVQDWNEFASEAKARKHAINIENWTSDSLKDLIQIFNVPNINRQFSDAILKIEPIAISQEVARTVRVYRNALGLIDIDSLSQSINETPFKCIALLKTMYPYVLVSNKVAMANQRQGGSVTTILLKQLLIKSPLSPSILVEGIERAAGYRRTPMVGTQEDLENLVKQIAGNPPNIENINTDISDEFTLGDSELWLKQVIGERSIGIIHRDELTELAIAEGINPSTIGVYLSFSTIIRNLAPGIFALVGTKIENSAIESYRNHFLAEYIAPTFEYNLIDERRMELNIIPNASLYTGGSLSINSGLREIIEDFRFNTKCSCGNFSSDADIRLAPSGYWIGFTSLLMHSRSIHNGGPGKPIKIVFDFYELSAELDI